mgnify:CR=1 FL=1
MIKTITLKEILIVYSHIDKKELLKKRFVAFDDLPEIAKKMCEED